MAAEAVETQAESGWNVPPVTLKVKLANQNGSTRVDATALVELPVG
jgi:hypothetical protein